MSRELDNPYAPAPASAPAPARASSLTPRAGSGPFPVARGALGRPEAASVVKMEGFTPRPVPKGKGRMDIVIQGNPVRAPMAKRPRSLEFQPALLQSGTLPGAAGAGLPGSGPQSIVKEEQPAAHAVGYYPMSLPFARASDLLSLESVKSIFTVDSGAGPSLKKPTARLEPGYNDDAVLPGAVEQERLDFTPAEYGSKIVFFQFPTQLPQAAAPPRRPAPPPRQHPQNLANLASLQNPQSAAVAPATAAAAVAVAPQDPGASQGPHAVQVPVQPSAQVPAHPQAMLPPGPLRGARKNPLTAIPSGLMGQLRTHRSGKVTLRLNNGITYLVAPGASAQVAEQVVCLDPGSSTACCVGAVSGHAVLSLDFGSLQ